MKRVMMSGAVALGLGLAVTFLLLLSGSFSNTPSTPFSATGSLVGLETGGAGDGGRVRRALLGLPLRFVVNVGQASSEVRYVVRGKGYTLFLTEQEVVLAQDGGSGTEGGARAVRLRYRGANLAPTIEGLSPMSGVANYFLGSDPAKWRTNVRTYEAVAYRDLYPGVDLVYRGRGGYLKSEYRIASGADPGAIHMVYDGVEALRLREDGALVLETATGELVEGVPLIYQQANGARRVISGGYVLEGENTVRFWLADYDPALPLVIDPMLDYSSFLGGSSEEYGLGITVDDTGSIYVTGYTYSTDFPTTTNAISPTLSGGATDAFVTQIISASGAYTYGFSTYLGGNDTDWGYDITVDAAGNIYVSGNTYSDNFPTYNETQAIYRGDSDAFVAQIIRRGGVYTLAFSTYLGGTGQDWGYSIAVDSTSSMYVAGQTSSGDFPTTTNAVQPIHGGGYDAFVTHIISSSGSYTYAYSTYLGGDQSDYSKDVAVDENGIAYTTGGTYSSNFPTTTNAIQASYSDSLDAFVTQIISASGAYTYGYSSYLGGNGYDYGWGVVVPAGSVDNVHVAGYTDSSTLFTRNAIQAYQGGYDVFVGQIISAAGVYTYGYFTYLGGSGNDWAPAIALDQAGSIYLTGRTKSSDFPTRVPVQATHANTQTYDAFVTQIISASGAHAYGYSTYLGGDGDDWGYAIDVDAAGNVYVTGQTKASDFPTTTNAIQPRYGGGSRDAFVAKIRPPYRVYLPVVLRQYP